MADEQREHTYEPDGKGNLVDVETGEILPVAEPPPDLPPAEEMP